MKSVRIFTFIKYLFFGTTAFIIDFLSLYICVSVIGIKAWLGAVIAFAISTIYAYLTQMRYTFSHKMKNVAPVIKYAFLLFVNICFTAVIVQLFATFFGLYMIGKIFATVCVTLWNFPIMKYYIFPRNIQ